MNKKYFTIRGDCLKKLFVLGSCFFLLTLLGCKKEQLTRQDHHSVGSSQRTTQVSAPCGTPYTTDLLAGQNIDAGNVTIYNTQDSLYIFVETSGNWRLTSTKIYVGTLAGMPQTSTGNPKVGQFPYKKNFSPSATSSLTVISLSGLPACYIVAVHVDLQEVVNGTVVQTQTGWANGSPIPGNNWAMYANYCTQACNPCVYPTTTTTLFAGQTINVGTLSITNDANNIHVTYQLTNGWYLGEVHLYVGPLSQMPVNSQNVPIPGHFPINETFGAGVQTISYTIPLAGLPPCYIIAAHASVYRLASDGSVAQTETAWGFGNPFQNTDRWGWTVPYCTQTCN
ncbi:hypothetical protein D3C71_897360 [compost metagenome]